MTTRPKTAAIAAAISMLAAATMADATSPVVRSSILNPLGRMPMYPDCRVEMEKTGDFAVPPPPAGDLAVLALRQELEPDNRPSPIADSAGGSNPWGAAPIQDLSGGARPKLAHTNVEDDTEILVRHMVVVTRQEPRGIALEAWGMPAENGRTRIAGVAMPGYVPEDAPPPTYTMRQHCPDNPKTGVRASSWTMATIWSERPLAQHLPERLTVCRINPVKCSPGRLEGRVLYRLANAYERHVDPSVAGRPQDTALWLDLNALSLRIERIRTIVKERTQTISAPR